MPRAYLDTNVHSAIAAGQVPAADVETFRVAVATGEIVAPISPANLDELVGQFATDRAATIARLASVRRLVGFYGMLKQPRDLLRDSIEAYAAGREERSVSLPESERRQIAVVLAEVCAGSLRHDHVLQQIVNGISELRASWLTDMQGAQCQVQADPEFAAHSRREWQRLPFVDYFAAAAPELAGAFAVPLGCADACRNRGLAGLLVCRPVRLCVGVLLSQIYSQLIGVPGHRDARQPTRSDDYDAWHAILASTADVFVTFDERLADHVERIPDLEGLRVVRSLGALLHEPEAVTLG